MKIIKSSYYQCKSTFLQVCLIVGILSVVGYIHQFAQNQFNTVKNQTLCSTTKKINPTYIDKLECSSLAILDFSRVAKQKISKIVR